MLQNEPVFAPLMVVGSWEAISSAWPRSPFGCFHSFTRSQSRQRCVETLPLAGCCRFISSEHPCRKSQRRVLHTPVSQSRGEQWAVPPGLRFCLLHLLALVPRFSRLYSGGSNSVAVRTTRVCGYKVFSRHLALDTGYMSCWDSQPFQIEASLLGSVGLFSEFAQRQRVLGSTSRPRWPLNRTTLFLLLYDALYRQVQSSFCRNINCESRWTPNTCSSVIV